MLIEYSYFLADRRPTNGRAIGTVLRPSVVCRLYDTIRYDSRV